MNIARHQRAEDDDARRRPRPRRSGRAATCEVVERVRGAALAEDEGDAPRRATTASPIAERRRLRVRHRREVDRQDERADEHDREDAAEVVDRLGRLVDVRRDEPQRQRAARATASGSVTRKTEPQSKCSSSAPESSGPSAAIAPPMRRPQRDRPWSAPAPDHSAVISASVVGIGHAGGDAAEEPGDEEDLDRSARTPASEARRDRQRHAEDQHQLAAVAVAERAEVEHRGGEAERVADGDEVELGLAGVERLADVGQRDVGDRQVEVGDRRDEDQRRRGRARRAAGRPRTPRERRRLSACAPAYD